MRVMGSHPGQSARLETIEAEILQSGRPLTIAVKTETPIDTDIDDARSFFWRVRDDEGV